MICRSYHGRRRSLIRRQSRRVTPLILYPERAHRLYFQFPAFAYFSCGWFVGGDPPTRRSCFARITALPSTSYVGQMKQQRVEFAVETTPPGCLFDHSTIFDYSFVFSCGWFSIGGPPKPRAVVTVLLRYNQRHLWPNKAIEHRILSGNVTPRLAFTHSTIIECLCIFSAAGSLSVVVQSFELL